MATYITDTKDQKISKNKIINKEESLNNSYLEHQKKQKKWEKMLYKYLFEFSDSISYDNYPVKPGYDFWNTLATSEHSFDKFRYLKIPESFVILGSNSHTWIKTCGDKVKKYSELEANFNDFDKSLQEDPRSNDDLEPFLIVRTPGGSSWSMNKAVYSYKSYKAYRSSNSSGESSSLVQKFIVSKGGNAAIARIHYMTPYSNGPGKTCGYMIRNKISFNNQSTKIGSIRKSTICKDNSWSFTVTNILSSALKEYEQHCSEVVNYLQYCFKIRIQEIVLDFILDNNGIKWMFNCKMIKIDDPKISKNFQLQENKKTLDELTCSVYCKLCGLIFKKDEASKTLTYKLLWEFSHHLKKRGADKYAQEFEMNHFSTRPCRVCDLCYMVVVSEHELIELEQEFAKIQNIPIENPYQRVPLQEKPKHRPALLNEILKQWRLMLFMENLIMEKKDLFNSFNTTKLYFQIKVSDIRSVFEVSLTDKTVDDTDCNGSKRVTYKINILRVYYFFSETDDISKILSDTEFQIRITRTRDWGSYICHGSSKTLNHFYNRRAQGQKYSTLVYLFFETAEFCSLKLLFGLVCDGNFNTANMNLRKFNGVYLPDNDFYNCNNFPIEWIEIFLKEVIFYYYF